MTGMLSCDVAFMLKKLVLQAHLFLIYGKQIYSAQNSDFSTVITASKVRFCFFVFFLFLVNEKKIKWAERSSRGEDIGFIASLVLMLLIWLLW